MAISEQERTVKVARETIRSLGWWVKTLFTFGLYLPWWWSKKLIVTNRRVIWRSGVVARSERSVPLGRVQDVSVRQSVLGRVLGYDDVLVESAGGLGTEIVARGIGDPGGVRDVIVRQV